MDRLLKTSGLLLQLLIGIAVFGFLLLSPPVTGRMILLPVLGADSATALQIALRHGAGLVGRGPIAGSLIISGELAELSAPLRAAGVILLAAPRGCGEITR